MKTKLLKRLRKEAHDKYQVIMKLPCIYLVQEEVYNDALGMCRWKELDNFTSFEKAKDYCDRRRRSSFHTIVSKYLLKHKYNKPVY